MEIAASERKPKPKPGPPKPIILPRRGGIMDKILSDLVSKVKKREENGGGLSPVSTIPHTPEVLQLVSLNCFVGEDSYLTFCTVVFVNIRNNAAGDLCCRGGGSVVLAVVGGICGVLGGAGLACGGSRGCIDDRETFYC
ncbi:hypothetical protein RHSIM_RhsimUnG0139200 [Rhododendron simsii]|uniref:Uncharacterized protein n=1 Tax=Rhododendron simsii TaxID=118357 RepID=A0A834FUK0_RHOSS|nr:hypothetical protein RHSIM_RhsimUnG0139200 [Rhododendron simsii]